ncbi:hypothetical protein ACFE04_014082 [Oxalis oulophora]
MDAWADIHIDIFFSVCARINYVDTLNMCVVCKSWNFLGSRFLESIPISPKSPWLMLAEEDVWGHSNSNNMRQFFDLSNGKIYRLNLPDTINRRCLSVGFGWLFTIDFDLQINLFHPLTGRKINLPPYSTFKQEDHDYQINGLHEILLWKAVASADPWNYKTQEFNQDCVITTTYGIRLLAFAKLGDKTWTDIKTPRKPYHDFVYYKSQLYAIGGFVLYACNFNGHQIPFTNPIARISKDLQFHRFYLVESAGELLFVCRELGGYFHEPDPLEEPDPPEEPEGPLYVTISFQVYKLSKNVDKDEFEFVKVETLGNNALFIGEGASFSLSATSMNGCCRDRIYFTDDSFESRCATKNGGGHDMGVYNLINAKVEQHYKGESLSYFSTPMCPKHQKSLKNPSRASLSTINIITNNTLKKKCCVRLSLNLRSSITPLKPLNLLLTSNNNNNNNNNNKKAKNPNPSVFASSSIDDATSAAAPSPEDSESAARARLLAEDEKDSSLDVGPNNKPLFTPTPSLSRLTRRDASTYFKFR